MRRRVLIVDDHRLFVDGLVLLLSGHPEIGVVGTCASAEEAYEACARLHPDVVLLDVALPGVGGVEATRTILSEHHEVQVLVISALQDARTVADALAAGARGFVPKTHAADELIAALRQMASGKLAISSRHAVEVLGELNEGWAAARDAELLVRTLTPREWEVLELLVQGMSTQAIASELFISPYTVRGHIRGLLSKLGVHSKMEVVSFAYQHGLVDRSKRTDAS